MLKEIYQSAMSKVKAGEDFYETAQALQSSRKATGNKNSWIRFALALFVLIIAVGIGIFATQNNQVTNNTAKGSVDEFEYTEKSTMIEASYISVVYLDGYAYSQSEWFSYSCFWSHENDNASKKGEKLGEVTLDLKGKEYTGTPPDFSSTHDVGTEIYTMKSVKPESAILVKLGDIYVPFYLSYKHVSTIEESIGLTIQVIFNMLSDDPEVVSIELRDEENGAWMTTIEDTKLISLINEELPGLSLLNHGQLESDPYASGYRVPVNLLFADGSALHMQVYPTSGMAYTFGGYISISKKLTTAFQALDEKGSPWPRLSELLPFTEGEVEYLYLKNHTNEDEILCDNPAWSIGALFQLLNYCRAEETEPDGRLVMTARMGKSETDNVTVNFYEAADRQILTEINGVYYKPIRIRFLFDSLEQYLYNYTELYHVQNAQE